jgi:hypothetical protein
VGNIKRLQHSVSLLAGLAALLGAVGLVLPAHAQRYHLGLKVDPDGTWVTTANTPWKAKFYFTTPYTDLQEGRFRCCRSTVICFANTFSNQGLVLSFVVYSSQDNNNFRVESNADWTLPAATYRVWLTASCDINVGTQQNPRYFPTVHKALKFGPYELRVNP